MGNPFNRILQRMGEVVEGIDAPLIPGIVMGGVNDTVDERVPHVHIGGGHVDLSPEHPGTVGKFPIFHAFKQG